VPDPHSKVRASLFLAAEHLSKAHERVGCALDDEELNVQVERVRTFAESPHRAGFFNATFVPLDEIADTVATLALHVNRFTVRKG
jgi:hypothetical protein